MRLFIALNFPEELRTRWSEGTAALRVVAPRARWAPPAQMHLTLAFLGEQPKTLVLSLAPALDTIAAASSRLSLVVQGIGAFHTWRRARVVWLGVEQSPPLMQIADSVERACRDLGIPGEGRAFHPHITLARLDERVSADQLRGLERAALDVTDRTVAEVDTLELMASTLGPGAAKHEVVCRARLGVPRDR
jgi:2'-5' RNA ligase